MQYKYFGKFIRAKRMSLQPSISLNKFAFDNDIDSAILSRIETMQQDIKLNILVKIAKGFGQTISEMFEEYEQYERENTAK